MNIRNVAKALIINNSKILVNRNQSSIGDCYPELPNGMIYYDLPGGGQNKYETLEEAVKRELLEETGYYVNIERLAAIYEEISVNENFRTKYERYAHKVHFLFICHLSGESTIPLAEKDLDMLESQWIKVEDVKKIPLYPQIIKTNFEQVLTSENILYLGSEHV
ncbi:MAG: NUDIX domain-containing protein [Defluviitaleaceae bacterium]|nr:NUDIX domain-containing protein [Defluviitaleaceae bacterium]